MDSLDQDVLGAVRRWTAQGRRFALVTVARTWGSAPRQPGAWMALRDDGQVAGSVSGGCVEDDLLRRVTDGGLVARPGTSAGRPFPVVYGATRDEALRWGLPCGGRLELVVEPAPDPALLLALAGQLAQGQLMRRRVDLSTGEVTLHDGTRDDELSWDGEVLDTLHGPRWRLLLIGAGQTSHYLARMAQALDYAVTVCDPRPEYAEGWDVPHAPWVRGMPDDAVTAMMPDAHTAIVALTHDPKLDDMALLEALKSPAFYVGALGSALNNARRRERLREHFDLGDEDVARLHGPVGLPIGSRTPPEIAVSIVAEMTAVRRQSALVSAAAVASSSGRVVTRTDNVCSPPPLITPRSGVTSPKSLP